MMTLKTNLDEIKEQLYNIKNIHNNTFNINNLENLVKKLEIDVPKFYFEDYGVFHETEINNHIIDRYSKTINCNDYLGCYFYDVDSIDIILILIERILNILKLELSYEDICEDVKFNKGRSGWNRRGGVRAGIPCSHAWWRGRGPVRRDAGRA